MGSATPYVGKVYAVGVDAGHDSNGNPRRGWLIYSPEGEWLGVLDEGYEGCSILRRRFPDVVELANRIPVRPSFYLGAMRAASARF